jgi:hypothetical protein
MPTITRTTTQRAETRAITIDAPPDAVLDLVSDPYRLPRWAPRFARAVRPAGDDWLVDNGERELLITVRSSREHGTLDLLAAADPRRGAFSRVLPHGSGSEYLFTLFFPADTPEAAVAQQMAGVQDELQTVRTLCEEPVTRP